MSKIPRYFDWCFLQLAIDRHRSSESPGIFDDTEGYISISYPLDIPTVDASIIPVEILVG
jgi:hypothetical protein